jgi:hypothetical protein
LSKPRSMSSKTGPRKSATLPGSGNGSELSQTFASRALRKSIPIQQSLPCIVCGCKLKNFGSHENHPLRGVEFVARGHYGSAVFDPQDGSRMIANICDDCLKTAKKLKKVKIIS